MSTDTVKPKKPKAPVPVPPPEKEALTYEEVEALGYCSARLLRLLVARGVVKRAIYRPDGSRSVRFLRHVLLEELQQRPPRKRK